MALPAKICRLDTHRTVELQAQTYALFSNYRTKATNDPKSCSKSLTVAELSDDAQ